MGTKRILVFLLAFALAVSVSACGGENPVVGSWKGTLDYSMILREELSSEDVWEEIPIEGIQLEIQFDFSADGSFTTTISQESVDAMVESLLALAVEGLTQNLKEQGTALEELDMTKEDLYEKLKDRIDPSTLTAPLEFTFGSGYYVYRNNCIYIGSQERSLRTNPEANSAEIMGVTLAGDTITVLKLYSQDNSAESFLPGLLPFDLVRQ